MTTSGKKKNRYQETPVIRLMKRRTNKIGNLPEELVYTGTKKAGDTVSLSLIQYNQAIKTDTRLNRIEDISSFDYQNKISWLNIDGIHNPEIVRKVGEQFGIHPLVQEDILQVNQMPKIEDHGDYIYLVMQMIYLSPDKKRIIPEQVSLLLTKEVLITFQEGPEGDVFNIVRDRLCKESAKIRKMPIDYLFYTLTDLMVDHYFIVLEEIGENIEKIETYLRNNVKINVLDSIYELKRDLLYLRKYIMPLKEIMRNIKILESNVIQYSTFLYFQDIYDHIDEIIMDVNTLNNMLSELLSYYNSAAANRMNEVIKVLTMVSTTFIPLSFLAGLFGMNFKAMPWIEWEMGFPVLLILMVGIVLFVLALFWRKKWLKK